VDRGRGWVERQDAASRPGTVIGWWQRYKALDAPRQSLLLTAYLFLAVFPAMLVIAEYLQSNPAALANHLVHRYGLSGSTARTLRAVLVGDETHKLGSALLAIASALFFGLGFGRVLQSVHARAWGLDIKVKTSDQARYAAVLLALVGLVLLLLVQTTELVDTPSWDGDVIAVGWFAVLTAYFVWAPRFLTRRLLTARDLIPCAAMTALGLVALVLTSTFVMASWVDLYSKDYAGLGVFMALFFWLGIGSTIIVAAATLAPALAERRDLLRGRTG
jgi:membrane protein